MKTPRGRLFIAAYRLPFKIIHKHDRPELFQNSGGLVSAVLSLTENQQSDYHFSGKIQWVGCSENTREELAEVASENESFTAHPVHLPEHTNHLYYEGFCNDLIWPLFHYFPSEANFDEAAFEAYQEANLLFCEKFSELLQPGDTVWIHDYQLMGLPALLREKYPDLSIGFFFHIPFPSYEIFRLLPVSWRTYLIDGMLGADVVGFHTNDYVQYFLGTVHRLYPTYEHKLQFINLGNRLVKVDSFPISIDFQKFSEAAKDPGVIRKRLKIQQYIPHRIIFSIDRLDYSKGLLHRLFGYEFFLVSNPEWHGRVTFHMVVVPSRDTIGQYQQMKMDIDQHVGRINATYGQINWQPVIYHYRSLSFKRLCALYCASDVALITPIRDGMNLVCKEYVASRTDNRGVLILSEMAGAASELTEALIINPTDKNAIALAIKQALEMSEAEQETRMRALRLRLKAYDIHTWTNDFFSQMSRLEHEQEKLRQTYLRPKDRSAIREEYFRASDPLLLIDYDGTLVPLVKNPADAILSEEMKDLLRSLAARSTVVIISGRDRTFLEKQLTGLPVHLVAEHGALIKDRDSGNWTVTNVNQEDWKDSIRPIMELYVKRCPGAFVEEKETSLAWHFRIPSDKLYAQRRANELAWQLHNFLQPELNLQIIKGNMVIEVKKTHYNKGTAALQFIESSRYDFILAMGDDTTDEDMFEVLPPTAFSIKVGEAISVARNHLPSQRDVQSFLQLLAVSPAG